MRALIYTVLFSFLLACGSQQTVNSTEISGHTEQPWRLTLTRSGGFAGLTQQLQLNHRGEVLVRDMRQKAVQRTTLDRAQLSSITEQLKAIPATGDTEMKPLAGQTCNDCFHYVIALQRGSTRYRANLDGSRSGELPYAPLLRTLVDLMQHTLNKN